MSFSNRTFLGLMLGATVLVAAGCTPPPEDTASGNALGDDTFVVTPSRTPILLVHGFNASPDSSRTFGKRIVDHLRAIGQPIYLAQLTPFASSEQRAAELVDDIHAAQRVFGVQQVHVVGHSQGGLDARIAASAGGLAASDAIRSITTIATPHHGTALADFASSFVSDQGIRGTVAGWLEDFLTVDLNDAARASCAAGHCSLSAALETMKERGFEQRFNAKYPNAEGVVYQSVATVSTRIYGTVDASGCAVDPRDDLSPESARLIAAHATDDMTALLRNSAVYVGHYQDDPNDGVVSVDSAKWGRFRGCVLGDHYNGIDQGRYAGEADVDNGLDVLSFYDRLVTELSKLD